MAFTPFPVDGNRPSLVPLMEDGQFSMVIRRVDDILIHDAMQRHGGGSTTEPVISGPVELALLLGIKALAQAWLERDEQPPAWLGQDEGPPPVVPVKKSADPDTVKQPATLPTASSALPAAPETLPAASSPAPRDAIDAMLQNSFDPKLPPNIKEIVKAYLAKWQPAEPMTNALRVLAFARRLVQHPETPASMFGTLEVGDVSLAADRSLQVQLSHVLLKHGAWRAAYDTIRGLAGLDVAVDATSFVVYNTTALVCQFWRLLAAAANIREPAQTSTPGLNAENYAQDIPFLSDVVQFCAAASVQVTDPSAVCQMQQSFFAAITAEVYKALHKGGLERIHVSIHMWHDIVAVRETIFQNAAMTLRADDDIHRHAGLHAGEAPAEPINRDQPGTVAARRAYGVRPIDHYLAVTGVPTLTSADHARAEADAQWAVFSAKLYLAEAIALYPRVDANTVYPDDGGPYVPDIPERSGSVEAYAGPEAQHVGRCIEAMNLAINAYSHAWYMFGGYTVHLIGRAKEYQMQPVELLYQGGLILAECCLRLLTSPDLAVSLARPSDGYIQARKLAALLRVAEMLNADTDLNATDGRTVQSVRHAGLDGLREPLKAAAVKGAKIEVKGAAMRAVLAFGDAQLKVLRTRWAMHTPAGTGVDVRTRYEESKWMEVQELSGLATRWAEVQALQALLRG